MEEGSRAAATVLKLKVESDCGEEVGEVSWFVDDDGTAKNVDDENAGASGKTGPQLRRKTSFFVRES